MNRVLLALGLLGVLSAPSLGAAFATGQSSTPFHAAYAGSAALQGCNPVMCQFPGTAAGFATDLGQSTAAYTITLDKEGPATAAPCELAWITATFVANSGGQVSASGSGTACPVQGSTALDLSFTYTISGGTGQFTGAGGTGSARGVMDSVAGTARTMWTGTLSLPG